MDRKINMPWQKILVPNSAWGMMYYYSFYEDPWDKTTFICRGILTVPKSCKNRSSSGNFVLWAYTTVIFKNLALPKIMPYPLTSKFRWNSTTWRTFLGQRSNSQVQWMLCVLVPNSSLTIVGARSRWRGSSFPLLIWRREWLRYINEAANGCWQPTGLQTHQHFRLIKRWGWWAYKVYLISSLSDNLPNRHAVHGKDKYR